MFHLITCNKIPIKSIHEYNGNFLVVHLYSQPVMVSSNRTTRYIFNIYHPDYMDIEEEYQSDNTFQFNLIPCRSIIDALTDIVDELVDLQYEESLKNEDIRDEITVLNCTQYELSRQVNKTMNQLFNDSDGDLSVINVYDSFKVIGTDKLAEMVKQFLNLGFVYPDDPVSFGYSILCMISGEYR